MPRSPLPGSQPAVARRDEARLRELDRKQAATGEAAAAALLAGRHVWTAAPTLSPNVNTAVSSWTQVLNEGMAGMDPNGQLVLSAAGRWFVGLYCYTDFGSPGNMRIELNTATWLAGWGPLRSWMPRDSGYGNAGTLDQNVTWLGVVDTTQLVTPAKCEAQHYTASASTVGLTVRLVANYMGPATAAGA